MPAAIGQPGDVHVPVGRLLPGVGQLQGPRRQRRDREPLGQRHRARRRPTPVSPIKTATASVPGAKISFGVPNSCVKAGSTFKVTLTWKKQKRKGNKFVKVRRADFYIGSKRVKIDKKAPFTQTLKVKAGTKAGSTITVKARAYVKVTKGKSPTKSISSKIKVCS